MSRMLMIIALLVTGTGCSGTQTFLSTVSVTPPRVTFRTPPQLKANCNWTAVAVTYPPERLTPAACTPTSVPPAEMPTFFEEDDATAQFESSWPDQSATMLAPESQVNASSPDPIGIVHLKDEVTPLADDLSVVHTTQGNSSFIETAVAVSYPSGALIPSPCAPSPAPSTEIVAFFEEDEHTDASSHKVHATSNETCDSVPSKPTSPQNQPVIANAEDDSNPPSVDTSTPSIAPVVTGDTPIAQTALAATPPTTPVRVESPSVQVLPDFSELLNEIRVQRKMIESLQRDLNRERSADLEAIAELEAAVEDLLVDSQATHCELPTHIGK